MKLLLIGQAATGKTTLSRALGIALDLPCHRIDDYRRWLGDGSVAGDYRARGAFLDACALSEKGIFEFSAVGHHRAAVLQALREHGTPVHVFSVACDEPTRKARIESRTLDIPHPDWGVGASFNESGQSKRLRADAEDGFWTGDDGWTQHEVRGDAPTEQVVHFNAGGPQAGYAGGPRATRDLR